MAKKLTSYTSGNNAFNGVPRLYIGQEPVKGAFIHSTSNCSNGYKQVYPPIYTLRLQNYERVGGITAGNIKYVDNIHITLVTTTVNTPFYYSNVYVSALSGGIPVSGSDQFSGSFGYRIYHDNPQTGNNGVSTFHTSTPYDIYIYLSISNSWGVVRNYQYDGANLTDGDGDDVIIVLKIPRNTAIASDLNSAPVKYSLDWESQICVMNGRTLFSDYTYPQCIWANNYNGSQATHYAPMNSMWPAGNTVIQANNSVSVSGNSYVTLLGFSFDKPKRIIPTTITSLNSLRTYIVNNISDIQADYPHYILWDNDYNGMSINYTAQIHDDPPSSTPALYFPNTTVYRYNGRYIDYGTTEVLARRDTLASQFIFKYSDTGSWVTTKNGNTSATYSTVTAYFKPSSYTTYQKYGYASNNSIETKVVIDTTGKPPTAQEITTYIGMSSTVMFPSSGYTSGLIYSNQIYSSGTSTFGYHYAGYLQAPAQNNTTISAQMHKGTYIFDYDYTPNSEANTYISRFRYSMGSNLGWVTRRDVSTWQWNTPGTFSFSYNWHNGIWLGNSQHQNLCWAYAWVGPPESYFAIDASDLDDYLNTANNTQSSTYYAGGNATWAFNTWDLQYGGGITTAHGRPSGWLYDVHNYITFDSNSWYTYVNLPGSVIKTLLTRNNGMNIYYSMTSVKWTATKHTHATNSQRRYIQLTNNYRYSYVFPDATAINQELRGKLYIIYNTRSNYAGTSVRILSMPVYSTNASSCPQLTYSIPNAYTFTTIRQ